MLLSPLQLMAQLHCLLSGLLLLILPAGRTSFAQAVWLHCVVRQVTSDKLISEISKLV